MEAQEHRSLLDLLHRDEYTPKELAELLGVSVEFVCQAAFRGELRARIVGHHVISSGRADVVAWLEGCR